MKLDVSCNPTEMTVGPSVCRRLVTPMTSIACGRSRNISLAAGPPLHWVNGIVYTDHETVTLAQVEESVDENLLSLPRTQVGKTNDNVNLSIIKKFETKNDNITSKQLKEPPMKYISIQMEKTNQLTQLRLYSRLKRVNSRLLIRFRVEHSCLSRP